MIIFSAFALLLSIAFLCDEFYRFTKGKDPVFGMRGYTVVLLVLMMSFTAVVREGSMLLRTADSIYSEEERAQLVIPEEYPNY
jgi:hypothetical protein